MYEQEIAKIKKELVISKCSNSKKDVEIVRLKQNIGLLKVENDELSIYIIINRRK